MGTEALALGADTFQFFTRNPRSGHASKIVPEDASALHTLLQKNSFAPVIAHAPYTLNPCGANPKVRDFALHSMADDMKRLTNILPNCLYNLHPGCHVGQGIKKGIELITEALTNAAGELPSGKHPIMLLETMAGKGTEIGSRFEELRDILDMAQLGESLGVCFDTCHVSDAGYDIIENLDSVLTEFDRCIGLAHLKAVHLNDSLNPRGSHKDRHARIGAGYIGVEALGRVINHEALRTLPFILETPNDHAGYVTEIQLLRKLYID